MTPYVQWVMFGYDFQDGEEISLDRTLEEMEFISMPPVASDFTIEKWAAWIELREAIREMLSSEPDPIAVNVNDVTFERHNCAPHGSGKIDISPVGVGVANVAADGKWLSFTIQVVPVSYLRQRGCRGIPEGVSRLFKIDDEYATWWDENPATATEDTWRPASQDALKRVVLMGLEPLQLQGLECGEYWRVPDDPYITVRELAEQHSGVLEGTKLETAKRYIQQEIADGRLRAEKIGNQYVIRQGDADAWLNNPRRGSRSKIGRRAHASLPLCPTLMTITATGSERIYRSSRVLLMRQPCSTN
ncbi:hypothetical protein HC928_13205 [bacterium]|nr:hypothetical protein [bacterium]